MFYGLDRDKLKLHTLETLRVLGTSDDGDTREEYLLSVLTIIYQAGQIDANDRMIARQMQKLTAESDKAGIGNPFAQSLNSHNISGSGGLK